MYRAFARILMALGPPLAIALLLAVFTGAAALPAVQAGPHVAAVLPDRYCYNWDFLNNTAQDADDLHIRLKGIQHVSRVYTGPLNPFGAPDASSGYDPATDSYALNFSNGVVPNGYPVHIGVCTDRPALRLYSLQEGPEIAWTAGGRKLQPAPLSVDLAWQWVSQTHLRVHLYNRQDVPLLLFGLNLLDAEAPLELDDLNADGVAALPMVADLAPEVQRLPPKADSFFDVFFDAQAVSFPAPDHPLVLEANLAAEDDSGNTLHLYSQGLAPLNRAFLPRVLKKQ